MEEKTKTFRFLNYGLILILAIIFALKCYECFLKLDQGLILTSKHAITDSPFVYPSFTVCLNMDREITGPVPNMTWWTKEWYRKYTKFPFDEVLTKVIDGFCW